MYYFCYYPENDWRKPVQIKSNQDLLQAYQVAKEKFNGELELEVQKKFNGVFAVASALALWWFFRPKAALALGVGAASRVPPLAWQRPYKLTMLGRYVAGAMVGLWALLTVAKKTGILPAEEPPKTKYGEWRRNVKADDGYSQELISTQSWKLLEGGKTDLEKLEAEPYPGVNTVFKAMQHNLQRMPNQDLLGHKGKAGEFEWMTWQQTMTTAENFSMGMKQLDLVKKLERDGRTWQFFGIQSKNNKEWVLANLAGMFQGMTSVGLFDTLGENAIKYICN